MSDHRFEIQNKAQVYKNRFYQIVVSRYNEKLQMVDENFTQTVIDVGLNTINWFVKLEKGFLLIGSEENKLQELYYFDDKLEQISHENSKLNTQILPLEYHEKEIDGWIIKPSSFIEGKLYPAVVFIHGGPKTLYGAAYNHDMQLLAHQGYFVILTNPRGSDGRGDAFADIKGQFAQVPMDDVFNYLDFILALYPEIDPTRLGVTGGSYGGYLTNYIITRTNRFKAAISERGICNLSASFLTSDIGFYYVKEYMGNGPTPWHQNADYLTDSPINQAYQVKTPTLFNHGLSDPRCHYTESVMMYQALLYHGVECELNLYPEEGHGFIGSGKPLHRLKRHQRFILWFNQYLKQE